MKPTNTIDSEKQLSMKPVDTIDREKLNQAVIDHAQVLADMKTHKTELDNIQSQINELDVEIVNAHLALRDFDLGNNSIGEIKEFAAGKYRAKLELETFIEIRDDLQKKLPTHERNYSQLDSLAEIESKRHCWGVLYDGLLKSIDIESLKQLIVVGIAAGKHEISVIDDLKLTPVEYQRLELLGEQFNLPAWWYGYEKQ